MSDQQSGPDNPNIGFDTRNDWTTLRPSRVFGNGFVVVKQQVNDQELKTHPVPSAPRAIGNLLIMAINKAATYADKLAMRCSKSDTKSK